MFIGFGKIAGRFDSETLCNEVECLGEPMDNVSHDNVSDEEDWIRRLRDPAERDEAISELREILVRGLDRSLSKRYGTGIQAEDVVQDALIKILDSLDQFQGRSRFATWAMTIATRIGISQLRRKHFQDVSLDAVSKDNGLAFDVPSPGQPTETEFDQNRLIAKLRELIDRELSDKQKLATHAILEGMPVEEIAARTGSNRNAVYKLIHDARARLREGFEKSGVTLDEFNELFA